MRARRAALDPVAGQRPATPPAVLSRLTRFVTFVIVVIFVVYESIFSSF
jgi:hypothetical protein